MRRARIRSYGAEHHTTLESMGALSDLLRDQRREEDADEMERRILQVGSELFMFFCVLIQRSLKLVKCGFTGMTGVEGGAACEGDAGRTLKVLWGWQAWSTGGESATSCHGVRLSVAPFDPLFPHGPLPTGGPQPAALHAH